MARLCVILFVGLCAPYLSKRTKVSLDLLTVALDSKDAVVSVSTIYDLMDSKMKSVGEAFFHDADKNKDGTLTHTEFKSVVQAHGCIRSLIEMRYSEASTLPGWQDIYAEVGVNGADKFTPAEVIGIFQKRGKSVLDEAEARAKKSMQGIEQTSGKASKTSVKKFLTANPSEKTFLGIGNAKDGLTGWSAFFGKMGSTTGAVGQFTVSDLVKLYQQQAYDVYPGECLTSSSALQTNAVMKETSSDSEDKSLLEETIYDLMNSKMKSVGEAFFHDADKNKDGTLTHTEFKNVVQAHDCIRSLIQMRFSEASTLPGWQDIYAEVGVNGADKFTPSEVVGIFQKRGKSVLDEAEARAKKTMQGIGQAGGKASKTSVKKFLTASPSEKTFLGIGNAKDGLTGWSAFFGKMGSTAGAVGQFTVSDLVKLYQQQAYDVYPGECLTSSSALQTNAVIKETSSDTNQSLSQETIYDLMNSKMKSVGETFFSEADKNKDGSLTRTEFKNVVQAHDCIRSLIQMRYSEASTLPGWQDIYAEVGVNGADKFTPSEVVGIFQKRGKGVLDEAETRAKKSMNGIQQTSGKASKTSVKKFLTANPSEKTFLRIGSAEDGLTGWSAFFGKMGSTTGAAGQFAVSDLVKLYQQQAYDAYPGKCL